MRVVCEQCGLPFSVAKVAPGKAVYCCSGCALAARVPVDATGQFPVNAPLVAALGVGFVFFNQVLFWLLAILLARRADEAAAANASRFAVASIATGLAVWLALAFFQAEAGARRAVDRVVLAVTLALLGSGLALARPELSVVANALFAAWALRGLARGKNGPKK